MRLGEGPLRTDDPLRDRRDGNEEGACDLLGGQTSEQAQRERDACIGREDRVARREDEAEEVVADVVVDCGDVVGHGLLLFCDLGGEFCEFGFEAGVAAEVVDGSVFRGGHEPCAGVVGDAGGGPLFEGGDERVLGEVFGAGDVAGEAGEAGDDAGGLDPPDGFDGAVRGVMWICSGHCYRSHQFWIRQCKWGYLFAA